MFDTYRDIFNQRGASYHAAMMRYPKARQEEFEWAIRYAQLTDGARVCDIPSGGCYLQDWLSQSVDLVAVETSDEFVACAGNTEDSYTILVCDSLGDVPLESDSVDRAISLAGSHHLEDRPAFYGEVQRILKPRGIFALADVQEGSGADGFLNTFVDQHNSMGHKGDFLRPDTAQELEAAGFEVLQQAPVDYHWRFDARDHMVEFCKLLFGIDQASDDQILHAIEHYLGYEELDRTVCMNWSLFFFQAMKPGTAAD
jgi:SAM-dependent methyltransferase